ncbi:efflux RND transporter periplasmic adaptor subunit [Cesiribacter andamanensis]|uniref:Putative efflux pump periplasmic linker ttgA n=1 Tax=Cesiribacter andamanensis AMV16 TaxID=1279009 RepID=M7NSX6_9BACT|nr:efflux RND transporter periplasmic adaptor subunit [Cesiribacter andamanensis]EMR01594.1 putative efflux pump periplasmic linker ttgA precursor [Cesiribacter andamanensis AMV16]
MKTWPKRILVIVVILLVVGLIAWPKIRQQQEAQPRQQAATQNAANRPIPVEVAVVQPQEFTNTLRVTGSVMANEMLELKSEVPGILESINFKEGQDVRKGQLLFTIRNNDLQAQLQKARARQKLVQDMENRQRQLLEREAVSQEEYDQAVNDLQSAEADIQLLQAQIAKTRVIAPFSGTIGLRFVSEGSYVAPGTSIASMYDLEPAKIDFSVPGKYSSAIKAGAKIRFTTDGAPEEYTGDIYAIEPQIDPATRTLKIRATSPNQNHSLLPGQFARVSLTLQEMDEALLVPTQAVVPELNGHKVFVVRQGKVAEQKVEIGQRTDVQVQIVSGLQAGDSVLTTGILQVRGGSPVQITGVHSPRGESAQIQ